jgi:hypothetical protein
VAACSPLAVFAEDILLMAGMTQAMTASHEAVETLLAWPYPGHGQWSPHLGRHKGRR